MYGKVEIEFREILKDGYFAYYVKGDNKYTSISITNDYKNSLQLWDYLNYKNYQFTLDQVRFIFDELKKHS